MSRKSRIQCSVSDCPARNKLVEEYPDVTTHYFQSYHETHHSLTARDKIWLKFCRRQESRPFKYGHICSLHFAPEAYERDLRNELLGLPVRRKLKRDAVPTIRPLQDKKASRKTKAQREREERIKAKERKELVEKLLVQSEEAVKVETQKEPETCLLCNVQQENLIKNFISNNDIPKSSTNDKTSTPERVANQSHIIFILRQVLDIPLDKLEKYLKTHGDPEQWKISLCLLCNKRINKILKVYEEFMRVSKVLQRMKNGIADIIKCNPIPGNRGRWDLPARVGKIPLTVAEDCREFVKNRPNGCDRLEEETISPFEIGDLLANELLELKQCNIKNRTPLSEKYSQTKQRLQLQYDDERKRERLKIIVKQEVDTESETLGVHEYSYINAINHGYSKLQRQEMKKKFEHVIKKVPLKTLTPLKPISHHVHCPFCETFKIFSSHGEKLCRHLDVCEVLQSQMNSNGPEPSEMTMRCPTCDQFWWSLEDKCALGEHLEVCEGFGKPKEKERLKETFKAVPLNRRIFQCNICQTKKYLRLNDFIKHYKYHKDRPFKCNVCDKRSKSVTAAKRHLKSKHHNHWLQSNPSNFKDLGLPDVPWWCPLCPEKCFDYVSRDNHVKSVHGPVLQGQKYQQLYQCPSCSGQFLSQEEVVLHEAIAHHPEKEEKKPRSINSEKITKRKQEYKCETCNKIFSAQAKLRLHVDCVHKKKFPYLCHLCGSGRSSNSGLKRHLTMKHRIGDYQKFTCQEEGCTKVYHTRKLFNCHMRFHRNDPEYTCDQCGKQFYLFHHFKRHRLLHENAETKPYQCDLCPKRFAVKDYLRCHKMQHAKNQAVSTTAESDGVTQT